MQRLLTAAAAAALVVTTIVFNSLRYPSVSVQLWRASQAAHGPATEPTAAGSVVSSGAHAVDPAEKSGTSFADRAPATRSFAASTTESATAVPSGRTADFAGDVRAAGETKPLAPADGRFTPESPELPRTAQQAFSEQAVWSSWRSEETVSARTNSAPTPPQPFGMAPRAGISAGSTPRPSNEPPASATAIAAEQMPPSAASSSLVELPKQPTAFSGQPPARRTDSAPKADPASGDSPSMVPVAKPVPTASAEPAAKPSAEPAADRAAVWSPASAGSAASRRSTETSVPASAGSWLSAAIPPPAPIPDSHRPDLVPVAPADPAAAAEKAGPTGASLPVRRLPPVDEGPTAPTKTPSAAKLPAYPTTRTP